MNRAFPRNEDYARLVLDRLAELTAMVSPELRRPVRALANAPGKRIRPHLLEVCSRFGAPYRTRLVRLGAMVELIHIGSLLHDDVIDRATVRRTRPAAHTVDGHEIAVLAGTACVALAAQEAVELGPEVMLAVSSTATALSYGELLDVERAFDLNLRTGEYVNIARHKTGKLFRLCCVLGAAEAGADPILLDRLAVFGDEVGVAFQIADDCRDLWSADTGKPIGTDHRLGLFGLPTLCALRRGAPGLAELLLSPALTDHDLPVIRAQVLTVGGIDEAMSVALRHREKAVAALGEAARSSTGQVLLKTIERLWPCGTPT
ncbi:polyprenyl synthetase family protein [Amycolatopsis sp. NPDC059021]|uniref:polyprenyl synthetase family protein n=1 Tax=Amycolatopsis sp. NPDC059021 TaxID=3346704 RepID=UPI003672D8A5